MLKHLEVQWSVLLGRPSGLCTALFDYDAQGEDELTLRKGQIVAVLSKDAKISGDDGWWTGKIGDKVSEGIVVMYVISFLGFPIS